MSGPRGELERPSPARLPRLRLPRPPRPVGATWPGMDRGISSLPGELQYPSHSNSNSNSCSSRARAPLVTHRFTQKLTYGEVVELRRVLPTLPSRLAPVPQQSLTQRIQGDRGWPSSWTDTMLLVMMSADGETLWTRSWGRGSRIPRHARAIDRPTVRPTTRCAQPRPQDPAPLHAPRPGRTSFSVVTQRWVPRAG